MGAGWLRDILRKQQRQTTANERLGDGMCRLADVLKKEGSLLGSLQSAKGIS